MAEQRPGGDPDAVWYCHLLAGGHVFQHRRCHRLGPLDRITERAVPNDVRQNAEGAADAKQHRVEIVLLDIVFSVDSVITAIGLTDKVWIIITAVVISFVAILFFAKPIGEFIIKHPALKILALSFLITIGITIFMEGMHKHVPKAYIYLPMGFAIFVELLQMRYEHNRKSLSTMR